jgi:uncharacterized membrane protein YjgN (DUF898 family)
MDANMNESSNTQSKVEVLPIEFNGSGGEFFKIWVVNLILSILTLGIYSAWAKVRTSRYFYGNTRLGNSGFEYHATPMAILKGRLIAVGLLLIYVLLGEIVPVANIVFTLALFIAIPWIIWRSIKFNARMSSYRNVRFAFDAPLKDLYRYLLLIPLLPILATAGIGVGAWLVLGSIDKSTIGILFIIAVLSIYLLIPYIQKSIAAYTINNYLYGQGELRAELSLGKYYKTYLAVIAWALGVFLAVGLLLGLAMSFSGFGMALFQQAQVGELSPAFAGMMAMTISLTYLGFILIGIWFKAYVRAKLRNHVFSQIQLDNVLQLQSNMTVGGLFGFYIVNFLLMVFTLGFAYPWVKVRVARFSANATQAHVHGSIDQYVTQQQDKQSALGEEMGEAFDVDAAVDLAI